jgi:hypothetical protein
MARLTPFPLLALLLAGCLDSGSASVKLKGKVFNGSEGAIDVDESYSFDAPEASPDYNTVVNAHTAAYSADDSGPFKRVATMTVYIPSLVVGPFEGSLSFNGSSRGTAMTGNIKGDVKEINFTGDGDYPVEVTGTFEGRLLGMSYGGTQEELNATDGKFTYRPRCDSTVGGSKYFLYCGSNIKDDDKFEYGPWQVRYDDCPAAVREAFAGREGRKARWNKGDFEIDGAEESLDCVRTMEDTRAICGTSADGIKAAGCSWDATAIGSATGDTMNLTIFARSSGSCEGGLVRCTSVLQASVAK